VWCAGHVEFVGCRFTGTLGVSYVLDAQKLSSVRPARAVFPHQDSRRRTVEEPVITGSLTMPEQWQAANVCSTHLVYVSVSSRFSIYITCHFTFADTNVLYIVIFKSVENVTDQPNGSLLGTRLSLQ